MARDQQMSSQIQSNVVERMEETTSGSSLRPRNPHDYESDAKTKKPSKRTLFTSIASDMPMTAAAAMTTASTSTTVMQPHKASSNNDSSDTGGGSGAASGYHLTQDVVVTRPFLRGKIHLFLLLVSPFWMFLIFSVCSSPRSFIAAAVSCFSFVLNFLASTLLHCFEWKNPTLHQIFHKLDHAGIFMVISGSTTPIPMLLLDFGSSCWLLIVQLGATVYGFCSIIFGDLTSTGRARRAYTYIFVGLLHALFLSDYYRVLTSSELTAVIALSSLYVIGALVYSCKRPDPFPRIYGFHEVFHSFCLLSFLLTMWLDYVIIRRVEWGRQKSLEETAV